VSSSDDGFEWLPNHKPYTKSCSIEDLPEAKAVFDSYITLTTVERPADLPQPLRNVSIFFVDFRQRGMIK
jgi:hypothetical protein